MTDWVKGISKFLSSCEFLNSQQWFKGFLIVNSLGLALEAKREAIQRNKELEQPLRIELS